MSEARAQAIEIAAGEGVIVRGQLWPGSPSWMILLHDVGEGHDLDRWRPLVPALLGRGWSVLAVDLRGHGASDGKWADESADADLAAITAFARSWGATALGLIAAGRSAALVLAAAGPIEPDALVLLSPADDPTESTAPFRGRGEAKLFLCAGADPEQRRTAERLRNASIGWAAIVNLPTTAGSTALLDGPYAVHAREQTVGFLAEQDFVSRTRRVRSVSPMPGRPPGVGRMDVGRGRG